MNKTVMHRGQKKYDKRVDPYLIRKSLSSESSGSEMSDNSEEGNLKSHLCKNVCKCKEKYIQIKQSSCEHVIFSRKHQAKQQPYWDSNDLTFKRQKLEMQLAKIQMEESHNNDQHDRLQLRCERTEKVMESLLQYVDCLQMEAQASNRLCQQLNNLVVNEKCPMDATLSQLIKKLCHSRKDFPVREKMAESLGNEKALDQLSLNYSDKKRDFNKASQNFKMLLQNANLNLNQLEKLQQQFDGILLGFQHSRCMLDQELPNIISTRMHAMLNGFAKLSCDLENVVENRLDLCSLLKHLESSLPTCGDLLAVNGNLHQVPSFSGNAIICNNCSHSPAIAGD